MSGKKGDMIIWNRNEYFEAKVRAEVTIIITFGLISSFSLSR